MDAAASAHEQSYGAGEHVDSGKVGKRARRNRTLTPSVRQRRDKRADAVYEVLQYASGILQFCTVSVCVFGQRGCICALHTGARFVVSWRCWAVFLHGDKGFAHSCQDSSSPVAEHRHPLSSATQVMQGRKPRTTPVPFLCESSANCVW